VAQPGQLGEGGREAPFLTDEGAVYGGHDRHVAEGGGEGRSPRAEAGVGSVGEGQGAGEPGQGRPRLPGFGHRHRGQQESDQGPSGPSQWRHDLPDPIHGQEQENEKGGGGGFAATAQAGQEGGAPDADPQREGVGGAHPARRVRQERPEERGRPEDAGEAESDASRSPAHAHIHQGPGRRGLGRHRSSAQATVRSYAADRSAGDREAVRPATGRR
jgi:hypothetical protein